VYQESRLTENIDRRFRIESILTVKEAQATATPSPSFVSKRKISSALNSQTLNS
jgi:hypothetical protein